MICLLLQSMTVEPAPRLSIRRPNSLLLKDNSVEFFVAFESKEEKLQWMKDMNQVSLCVCPIVSDNPQYVLTYGVCVVVLGHTGLGSVEVILWLHHPCPFQ